MLVQNFIIIFFLLLVSGFTSFNVFASEQDSVCPEGRLTMFEGVCIPICGEGTKWEPDSSLESGGRCIIDDSWGDTEYIAAGIVLAVLATVAAIIISVIDKRNEKIKRTQELIQLYDEELRKIADEEKQLQTKLDCTLYVERYLDTLEKIATLSNDKNFGKSVSDFFENNFSYGIDLWRWYQKNVVKIREDLIGFGFTMGALWKMPTREENKEFKLSSLTPKELTDFKKRHRILRESIKQKAREEHKDSHDEFKEDDFDEAYQKKYPQEELSDEEITNLTKEFLDKERWSEFRTWCKKQKPEILPLQFEFGKLQNSNIPKNESYKILPDILYNSYEFLPEENGLSKSEFLEIIRDFANDLSSFVQKEKELKKPEDYSIYAEQYLDTLEQISSLYRNKIIPTKNWEYFENKFAYGQNLWVWYFEKVLKYSSDLYHALWEMDDKKIEKGKENQIREINYNDFKNKYHKEDSDLLKKLKDEDKEVLKLGVKVKDLKLYVGKENELVNLMSKFVNNFSINERWRDFRWWCKQKEITPFEEDREEGLILPKKMWDVKFPSN